MQSVNPVAKKPIPWGSVSIGEPFPDFKDYYYWHMFEIYDVYPFDHKHTSSTEVLTSPYKIWKDMVSGMPFNNREFARLLDKLIEFHQVFNNKFPGNLSKIQVKDYDVFDKLDEDQIKKVYIPELNNFLKSTYTAMSQISLFVTGKGVGNYIPEICSLPISELVYDSSCSLVELFNGHDGKIVLDNNREIEVRIIHGE